MALLVSGNKKELVYFRCGGIRPVCRDYRGRQCCLDDSRSTMMSFNVSRYLSFAAVPCSFEIRGALSLI